ncbi:MAG: tRNA (guanosine(37)-N1)-methyltransferase TrmD, partial [Clostridia bacterium]|nr:tRNA (guanosine(37)-N1)-methyltransferase TrmD [Clostridia bacterium]
CGHYEGVDERVIEEIIDEEISIGDYVLTGGELPACIIVDAVARLVEGVLSDKECYEKESIASGLLEYPQYTRPPVFNGKEVPNVLLSGHHANIEKWRLEKSLELTKERRPDLYEKYISEHPPKQKKKK